MDWPGAVETICDSRLVGEHVVRLINTVELEYRQAHSSFVVWSELYRSGATAAETRSEATGLAFGPRAEIIAGWSLAIVVSRDGKSYQLSLRSVDDTQCRFSFFSDPSRITYQGNVIGCPSV